MSWFFTPICIRCVPKHSDEPFALSGVFSVLSSRREVRTCLFFSVCNVPLVDMQTRYNIYITCKALKSHHDLDWFPGEVKRHTNLFHEGTLMQRDKLLDVLKVFSESGFSIIPFESKNGQNVDFLQKVQMVEFKIKSNAAFEIFYNRVRESLEPFEPGFAIGRELAVRSTPFSFTNAALFQDFVSVGTIVLEIYDENDDIVAYISDMKYLENMIGGVALQDAHKSLGLVLCNVRKRNGDGELVVIVPWTRLGKRRSKRLFETKNSAFCPAKPSAPPVNALNHHQTVFAVVVEDKSTQRMSWGSCVYYNSSTLVTNDHVIHNKQACPRIRIQVNRSVTIHLQTHSVSSKYDPQSWAVDQLISPHEGLDLCFIKLSKLNQQILGTLGVPEFDNSVSPCEVGDEVTAVGFGLLLNPLLSANGLTKSTTLQPLASKGVVSTVLDLPLFVGLKPKQAVIVTSASCWNGSSGGGLFESKSGTMIGLICSNAQVNLPEMEFQSKSDKKTEKVPTFSLCIPANVITAVYKQIMSANTLQLEPNIVGAWKLLQTHEDVIVENVPKL